MSSQTPWFISADGHMSEPLDLWTTRLDKKFRDRAPHVEFDNAGQPGAWWVYEGYKPHDLAVGIAGGQIRTDEEKHAFIKSGGYADARPGGWDPAERLKDMAADGVVAEVLYTTLGFRLFWLLDPELQRECFRVYNDWRGDAGGQVFTFDISILCRAVLFSWRIRISNRSIPIVSLRVVVVAD